MGKKTCQTQKALLYTQRLPANLCHLRISAGFTQHEVACALGITRSTYSYYENGKTTPSIESLWLLSNLYQISMESFFVCDIALNVLNKKPPVRRPIKNPTTIGHLTHAERKLILNHRLETHVYQAQDCKSHCPNGTLKT